MCFLFAGGITNSCVWQTGKSNNLFTPLQTKGYSDFLCLHSYPSLSLLSPSLFLSLSIFFSSRVIILSSLFPMSLCWLCDRNHAMQVPWQQVECILPLSANLPHLMTQAEWGISVCVCVCMWALNSSDLYLWIKAMGVRNRFIYPVKLYKQYCIQKMRNHNWFRTLTCQFIRIPSNLVSGLSANGGFMRRVCLHSSVSSTKPPWGVEDTLAGVILVNPNNLFWQTRRDVWQWGVNFHWKSGLNGSLALFHPMLYIYLNSLSSWNSFVNLTNRLHSVWDLMTHFMTHRITPVHLLHSLQCTPTSITHTGS